MRIFVAGASGAIGRPLVRRLVGAGHEVVGMARSETGAGAIRTDGAPAVLADALDPDAVIKAIREAKPDVVVHQLTAIPPAIDPRRFAEAFATTNRLRREGTRNLVAAAEAAGARRVVAQSKQRFPIAGGGPAHWSFIHVDDAAAATTAALDRGAAGVYNIIDDDPAPVIAWLPVYAEALGAPEPRHVRPPDNDFGARGMLHQRGASNAKAKEQLGWSPGYASWRTGFAATLAG